MRIDIETAHNPAPPVLEDSHHSATDLDSHHDEVQPAETTAETVHEEVVPASQRGYSERTRMLLDRARQLLNPIQEPHSQSGRFQPERLPTYDQG